MKIRQIVRKINESLKNNPAEWIPKSNYCYWKELTNSRGISISDVGIGRLSILFKDKWRDSYESIILNDKEYSLLINDFRKSTKILDLQIKQDKIKKDKRRGWLCREILKTL